MEEHPEEYALKLTKEELRKEFFKERVDRMRETGQYPEHVEMGALSKVLERSILVYDVQCDCVYPITNEGDSGQPPVHLRLTNSKSNSLCHYDLLVPVSESVPQV